MAHRVVLDTNVLLAGLVSPRSPSQQIVDALSSRRVLPLVSRSVLAEYRRTLNHPSVVARFPKLTPPTIAKALHRLRYVADEIDTTSARFEFARDPMDAKFLELAIAGVATHIISMDDDMLSLRNSNTDAGKRFRQRARSTLILSPAEFLEELR